MCVTVYTWLIDLNSTERESDFLAVVRSQRVVQCWPVMWKAKLILTTTHYFDNHNYLPYSMYSPRCRVGWVVTIVSLQIARACIVHVHKYDNMLHIIFTLC